MTLASLTRQAAKTEIAMWRSLYGWITRRPIVLSPGAQAFPYSRSVMPILWAFIGVSAVELPIFHLVIPWQWLQIIADAAGVYGLLWMIGLMAMIRSRPHIVDESGLSLRCNMTIDLRVPWDGVESIQHCSQILPPGSRSVVIDREGPGPVLVLAVAGHADVEVTFREPTVVAVPRTKGEPVTGLRFGADEPAELIACGRSRLARRDPVA